MAGADMDKATSELKDYAGKLLMVRGVNFPFGNPVGCGHSSGCNQTLTAARMKGRVNRSTPVSESADMRIARMVQMGKEPHHPVRRPQGWLPGRRLLVRRRRARSGPVRTTR